MVSVYDRRHANNTILLCYCQGHLLLILLCTGYGLLVSRYTFLSPVPNS